VEVKSPLQTEYTTLLYNYKSFLCTLSHQNSCCNYSKRSSEQQRGAKHWNQRQRCKQMQQQVPCKLVTIKSSSKTNCTESVTNRFQQNEKRSHRPTRSTRLELTYKAHTLTFYSQKSNCTLQSNTHPLGKSSLSCNSRTKRYQPKRVTYLQKEEKYTKPNYSCFPLNIRESTPSSRLTVRVNRNIVTRYLVRIYFPFGERSRTSTLLTPFQMNTFQSLSVPKTTHRFTKTRQSTISSLCPRMVQRMINYH